MRANELRHAFTTFFAERGHTPVPSSGLIPLHPSAPMFTNSGMMQFVPIFLGEEQAPYDPPRAVTVQKCVRAGGKHNDLDAIGRSPRHLSFFEMLGNFSFGDYFKEGAIPMAWEFVTEVLGIDGDRIWVTVHTSDDEAEDIWADQVGFPRERIQRLDKDNFWEMGETGPCGPSSELFYDYGAEIGPDGGPANPEAEHRFVEIWNLVFPQYFRGADGQLSDLPKKNIDTGAGMERILALMAGSPSLYAADVLSVLVDEAQRVTGHRLGESEITDVALRLMADHTRTMTFLVSDGVIPSNEDRGYVLRRIIRRAIRFAYVTGVERLVLGEMIDRCIGVMSDAYPELIGNRDLILSTIEREEAKFRQTLKTGSSLLDSELSALPAGGRLDGEVAFKLHDTYGFPLEVTQEFTELGGYELDVAGFEAAMANQRANSKAGAKATGVATDAEAGEFRTILDEHGQTTFVGREVDESPARVIATVGNTVVLDVTPFYAESGGQIGDTGSISWDGTTLHVIDTNSALPGLVRHVIAAGDADGLAGLAPGTVVTATIDADRRNAIRRHHTATHILHWALRSVLGTHVKQQGSWVGPDRLRFDFSHFEGLTPDQIVAIEDLANREILTNAPVSHEEMTKDEAMKLGAIAFFGDKYGDTVRVLQAGPNSIEFCGGTHVQRGLGDIGPLKIVSETSIGSNIRRLEAIAGLEPIKLIRSEERTLSEVAATLGVPVGDIAEGLRKRLDENKAQKAEIAALRRQVAQASAGDLVDAAVDGVLVARIESETRDEVRDLAVSLRDRPGMKAVVLISSPGGKGVAVAAAVDPESGLNAGEIIADAVKAVGGGGGKGEHLATAGGRNADGIDEALQLARAALGVGS
ncbi:MAG TPA: alanine--tRNA ligase [Microthrixaceae bacterium]|nr:alanine--tRNA ligase [Microthrixaceae bacterium]